MDQFRGGDGARGEPLHADGEQGESAEGRDGLDHRVEGAARATDIDGGGAQPAGDLGEAAGFVRLPAHHLHQEGTIEALVRDLGDFGAQLLSPSHLGTHATLKDSIGGKEQRKDREADGGEDRIHEEHLHGAGDQHDDHAECHRQRHEDPPRGLDIGIGVG